MNDFINEVSAWSWDGVSIENIKARAERYKLSLEDLIDDAFVGGWPESVPELYRGFIRGRIDSGHRYYMEILACDQNGRALVMRGVANLFTDAEGYKVVETTTATALAWADSYRLQAATCP
ncbi:TPA: hypothetical protein ACRND3_006325 [Pseudomonas aeruginosa]|uniref:hypothetical protein n=1 Tax=Pseudomonas aeruginosa TaxID=287 RepID=UPI00053E958E|nr:hypothetical protein [Pseudomonas aeruginosa]MCG0483807.1 hypothetical protein [Pseudomonas aeruginosa]TJY45337.1 hypothetical protein FCG96_28945 [Pseudomonas aeruginosa]HBO0992269.1 hypothetical protein [Pseudomonas aeruginosa]HBO1224289.1 hypothetical protein [Pseudomonas aeruginosa]HBO1242589.1 hypothetical protein [Pseudomonas aeruginosa]